MTPIKVLIPIPSHGFDPSEVAVPWKLLVRANIKIVFATPQGAKAKADQIMLTGEKLGIFKSLLMARKDAVEAYREMDQSADFCHPIAYKDIQAEAYNGILLPGGHDKGVKEYLESTSLQEVIPTFFSANKTVGAICHGLVLLARSINPITKKSVLYDYKVTALLQSQEKLAYKLTRLWLKDYYLTYPGLTVEQEVKAVLADERHFLKGNLPVSRDSESNLKNGYFVKDRNLISARWPGDVYGFSLEFIKLLQKKGNHA